MVGGVQNLRERVEIELVVDFAADDPDDVAIECGLAHFGYASCRCRRVHVIRSQDVGVH